MCRNPFFRGSIAFCLAGLTLVMNPAEAADDELTETATRNLVRSVTSQQDGSHLTRLSSLRVLRDPAMEDLFYKLIQHDEWQVQVHAMLGLAEINEQQSIDPWLVTQIEPLARDQVIANALDMDLLDTDGMKKILEWDHLESTNRLLLMAELQQAGEQIDMERLQDLSGDNYLVIAAMASLLIAEQGDTGPLSEIRSRLQSAAPSERSNVLRQLFEFIRIYELRSSVDWLDGILTNGVGDPELDYWGTFTLITLDPIRGREHWNRMVGNSPTYRLRIRAGQQFLEAGLPSDAAARATLSAADDELIEKILDTADGIASNQDVADRVIVLIDTGHPRMTEWAMRHARELPVEDARAIYGHFIDRQGTTRRRAAEYEARSQAIVAMAHLLEIDPDSAIARLEAAEDDSITQQTLLMGSVQSLDPRLEKSLRSIRRIGASLPDSLTLLLLARYVDELDDADIRQLGLISAGGGMLSDDLQVQAAWLYLKHTGGLQDAMVELAPSE